MEDTTIDEWMSFFRDAGIPPNVSASYASSFCQNRIHLNMVLELNRDLLKELGVTVIGDAIAILRHAKFFHEQNVRQKILKSMSPDYQKPAGFNKKLVSTTDVASATINSKKLDGGASGRVVSSIGNNHSGLAVACGNDNNQEIPRMRQQAHHTRTQYSLQRCGMSVTAASSQTDNIAQNISVGPMNREELQLCEAPVSAIGEADTTEDMNFPHIVSRSQNNNWTFKSESFLMREPVESKNAMPLRQATVASHSSGNNYLCRRNQGLKRSTQQSPYDQSSLQNIEDHTLQDAYDEVLPGQSIKRQKTMSLYRPYDREQIETNVCLRSVGTGSGRKYVCETQSTTTANHSEESQIQESSHLDVSLPVQAVSSALKSEVAISEEFTKNESDFEKQHQLSSHRRHEVSPVQFHTRKRSQERMQMSQSQPETRPQPQIMSVPQVSSPVTSPSQKPFQRISKSHLQDQASLKLHHVPQSSSPPQPPVQPQSSQAIASKASKNKNLQLQNQEVTTQHNPVQSCSAAKLILVTGKRIKKKKKSLHARSRMSCMNSVPQSVQTGECSDGSDLQILGSSAAVSRHSNKSVLKETENIKKKEQTMSESANATCISWNESQNEINGANGDLMQEEMSNQTDLKMERSMKICDSHQGCKPLAHTSSDILLYDDSSSHTFDNSEQCVMSYVHQDDNNLQFQRVPGQIFSRLGVKVELVSADNDVSNTTVENDALPSCSFESNLKYKEKKSKKHKHSQHNVAKTTAVEGLSKCRLTKRKVVFTPFQEATSVGGQNIVAGHTSQDVVSIDEREPKLRGILKPHTITSKEQQDMQSEVEAQSQRMTANLLLQSVATSDAENLGIVPDVQNAMHFEENSLRNVSVKSEGDYIYLNSDDFCSSDDETDTGSTSGPCSSKTVRFGPVCIKEFQQNVPSSSGTTVANSKAPIFSRLGARRKGI